MTKNLFILIVCLCTFIAGQVFAGNPVKSFNGKSATTQVRPFSKMPERKRQANNKQNERLHEVYTAGIESSTVPLRSSLEPEHNRPDSAVFNYYNEDTDKHIFSYNGDTITEISYRKNYVYDYETDNWFLDWDMSNYREEKYVFDAYGNEVLRISLYYDDNIVYSGYKDEYAYNPNGTPLFEKWYDWEDGQWELYYEAIYQYDETGMLTGGSINHTRGTYTITVSGTPERFEMLLTLDGGIIAGRMIKQYDPVTMKELRSEEYYLTEEGNMVLDGIYEYTYDAAGRLVTSISSDDYYSFKDEYEYDATGRKLSITESETDDPDGTYNVYGKRIYEYANNRLAKFVDYRFYDRYYDYETDSYVDIYLEDGIIVSTTTFYYSGGTNIVSPGASKLSIYAADGQIIFTLPEHGVDATLQLIDLAGRTILTKQAVSGRPVATPSLPEGVYIYRIQAGTCSYNGKLFIRK